MALHFFARWCASCQLDLTHFQTLSEKYAADDVVVLGLAYASGDRESLAEFTESLGVTFPVLMTDDDVLDAYNVATFPSNAIVDRDGRIRELVQRLMDARYWDRVLGDLVVEGQPRSSSPIIEACQARNLPVFNHPCSAF